MAREADTPRSEPPPVSAAPTAQELKAAIDSGRTGDKVAFLDPAAAPLGTDDEAAGTPDAPPRVATALRQETGIGEAARRPARAAERVQPVSPNIQIYRPQLNSVLSIANRITGVVLSIGAVGLVVWLIAAASGPRAYAAVQGAIASWIGQIVLFGFTFALFLHLLGGHPASGLGYRPRIRAPVDLSVGMGGRRGERGVTTAAWAISLLMGG